VINGGAGASSRDDSLRLVYVDMERFPAQWRARETQSAEVPPVAADGSSGPSPAR
jgi:hypothetical protein